MRRVAAVLVVLVNAVCAVLALAVVAVTAAFVLIDPNDYKARIVDAVQDATGRTLTLGELTLTRSLWPTLRARDVSLSNLPGGSRPDMAHAERIEGQLSLLALLRHEIDITRLTLIGPNILFEQVDGQPNWVFTPAPTPAPSPIPAAPPGEPFDLRVERAHVQNGMVTWKLPARTKVVGIRTLDFRSKRKGGPIEVGSTLVYSDNAPFQLDITAQPTGGVLDPWQTQLHFAAFDADATAKGTFAITGPYDLQLEASAGALEKLNALLPEMGLPALRQATLSAHLANGPRPGDIPVIGPATLDFASVDLRDRLPGLVLGTTRVTLPAPGGQAAIDSAGSYAGTAFQFGGSVGVPTRPDGKTSLPVQLSLTAAPAKAGLKGTLSLDTLQFAGLDAAATLQAEALAGLRPVLGDAVPALADVRFAGQVTLPAGAGPVRLRGVTLQSAQGDLAGDGSVDATPAITGTWRSDSIDMEAMLDAFGVDLSAASVSRNTGPVIPQTPLPWASLRGPTLDLSLAIGSMRFAGETWRDVRAAIALKGGRLEAGPVSVAMPGARMQASLTVDAATAGTPVGFALSAPALPLELIARYFNVPGPMVGTAGIDAQWRARGATMRALASTLDGPFSIRAVGGRFTNRALIDMTQAALNALGIAVPPQGETRLDCLGIAGVFARGVGTLRTIALQTTYLSLGGVGQVDLGRETVLLNLQPMAQVAGSSVSVPVVVQGPFRNVSGKLDAGGLQQLGFLLDGLFGGDTSRVCEVAGLIPR